MPPRHIIGYHVTLMNRTTQLELPLPGSPAYTVRVSPRARHVRLKISAIEGVVVITPRGFDPYRIPEILIRHKDWLHKHISRLNDQHTHHARTLQGTLPESVELEAIGERWTVEYTQTSSPQVSVSERSANSLLLRGNVQSEAACRAALRRWLTRKAYRHLEPWLRQLSEQTGMPFRRLTVRGQRTRWGSCSRQKTININYKLLFLPAHLVRHVFLHELCHTRVMNHSPEYWHLLAEFEPAHKSHRRELHETGKRIPAWANR